MDEDLSVNRARIGSGFSFLYHGSCSRCHHFHVAKRIFIPANHNDRTLHYPCDKCGKPLFGAGGRSARISLASRLTSSSWTLAGSSRRPTVLSHTTSGLGIIHAGDEDATPTEQLTSTEGVTQGRMTPRLPEGTPTGGPHADRLSSSRPRSLFRRLSRPSTAFANLPRLFRRLQRHKTSPPRPISDLRADGSRTNQLDGERQLRLEPTTDDGIDAAPNRRHDSLPVTSQSQDGTELPTEREINRQSIGLGASPAGPSATRSSSMSSTTRRVTDRRRELTLKHETILRLKCRCHHTCSWSRLPRAEDFRPADSGSRVLQSTAPSRLRSTQRHSDPTASTMTSRLPYPASIDDAGLFAFQTGAQFDGGGGGLQPLYASAEQPDPLLQSRFSLDSSDIALFSEPAPLDAAADAAVPRRLSMPRRPEMFRQHSAPGLPSAFGRTPSVPRPAPTPPRRSSSSSALVAGMPLPALLQLLADRPQVVHALRMYERAMRRDERRRSSQQS